MSKRNVIKRLEQIHADICAALDQPGSRAVRASSLLKALEDGNILGRLYDVIDDMEYDRIFVDEADPRIEKYQQILNIVMSDFQPKA